MRLFSLIVLAFSLAAKPAAAQSVIRAGQSATGRLTAADSALGSGARYDVWRFQARAGHTYWVYLWADFDAALAVGRRVTPRCGAGCVEGHDTPGGLSAAEVEFVPAGAGAYLIRAGAARAGETGEYELRLEEYAADGSGAIIGSPADAPPGRPVTDTTTMVLVPTTDSVMTVTVTADTSTVIVIPTVDTVGTTMTMTADTFVIPTVVPATDTVYLTPTVTDTMTGYGSPTIPADTVQMPPVPLRAGASVKGVLDERDRRGAMDAVYLDAYTYRARAGETVVIRMRSDDFDTEVRVLRSEDGTWNTLGLDDDGGGGTNSELTITFPEAGRYEIHARAYSSGQTGRYTLSVARP